MAINEINWGKPVFWRTCICVHRYRHIRINQWLSEAQRPKRFGRIIGVSENGGEAPNNHIFIGKMVIDHSILEYHSFRHTLEIAARQKFERPMRIVINPMVGIEWSFTMFFTWFNGKIGMVFKGIYIYFIFLKKNWWQKKATWFQVSCWPCAEKIVGLSSGNQRSGWPICYELICMCVYIYIHIYIYV